MNCTVRTTIGNVGSEILAYSRKENVDLIVIGRGAGSNMINRLLGDFIKKLIHKSHCPRTGHTGRKLSLGNPESIAFSLPAFQGCSFLRTALSSYILLSAAESRLL